MMFKLYIEVILIAISLSMDAFSLAISLSTSKLINHKKLTYAYSVGLFHFFMPVLGFALKGIIDTFLYISSKTIFICVICFIILGIILDNKNNLSEKILNPIMFAFAVSIDSFSVGITLNIKILLISCTIFSFISFIFTYIGFKIGEIISKNLNNYSKTVAILVLIIVLLLKLM